MSDVFSVLANSEHDNSEARRKLGTAKKLAIAGIVVGTILSVLVVLLTVVFTVILIEHANSLNGTESSITYDVSMNDTLTMNMTSTA